MALTCVSTHFCAVRASTQARGVQIAHALPTGFSAAAHRHAVPNAPRSRFQTARAFPEDAWNAWGDLASLVASSGGGSKTPYDGLADKIGDTLYLDVNGWHLYLRDVRGIDKLKMHQVVAQALGMKLKSADKSAQELLEEILKVTPVRLGGEKVTFALWDLIPAKSVEDTGGLLERYKQDL